METAFAMQSATKLLVCSAGPAGKSASAGIPSLRDRRGSVSWHPQESRCRLAPPPSCLFAAGTPATETLTAAWDEACPSAETPPHCARRSRRAGLSLRSCESGAPPYRSTLGQQFVPPAFASATLRPREIWPAFRLAAARPKPLAQLSGLTARNDRSETDPQKCNASATRERGPEEDWSAPSRPAERASAARSESRHPTHRKDDWPQPLPDRW